MVDPLGVLGGSSPKTGDPNILDHIKIGGSSETTYPLYNIKEGNIKFRMSVAQLFHF